MFLKTAIFLMTAAACTFVAHASAGRRGFEGALLGVGASATMCGASAGLTRWVRRADGHAILAAVFASTLTTFALMLATVLALHRYLPDHLVPGTLTALVTYLVFRFFDVFRTSKGLASSGRERRSGRAVQGVAVTSGETGSSGEEGNSGEEGRA